MISNAAKGAYYKARTRKWLIAQGYQVADLEIVRWLFTPKGRIPVKRDQFASDLLAMKGEDLIFIQVKGGAAARGNGTFPAARREFGLFTFPESVLLWIVAWAPKAREPRILNVETVNLQEGTGTHVEKESREAKGQTQGQEQAQRKRLAQSQAQGI